jgi:hypothetical protein
MADVGTLHQGKLPGIHTAVNAEIPKANNQIPIKLQIRSSNRYTSSFIRIAAESKAMHNDWPMMAGIPEGTSLKNWL